MAADKPIVGVLLAGGRSSRFGGGDKCLSPLFGKPLLAHAIERLRPQVPSLVLNANGDARRFASFGLPVIADYASARIGDFAGPLAGLLAAMIWVRAHRPDAKLIVSVATDTPFFPTDLVARLVDASDGGALAVARSEIGVHPVFGLWPIALADALRADLEAGKRKVLDWTADHGAIEVAFESVTIRGVGVDPFLNINRAEDLAQAEALLAASIG